MSHSIHVVRAMLPMVVHIHRRWGMCSVHVHIHTTWHTPVTVVIHSEDDFHFQLPKVGEDK